MTNTSVTSGNTVTSTTVSDQDNLYVYSGGTAVGTVISAGGTEILSGGTTTGTVVSTGGAEIVSSGGTASGTVILSGNAVVSQGGTEYRTTAGIGGTLTVASGGYAFGAVVSSGGNLVTSAGGSGLGATVKNGGIETVLSGGSQNATQVNAGGLVIVSSGGVVTGTTIAAAGTVEVQSGGSVVSGVTFMINKPGGTLDLADVSSLSGTISGFGAGDTISLTSVAYDSAGMATFDNSTDVLTVTEGGTSYTLDFTGDYTSSFFHLVNSGGGTEIIVNGTPCYCRGTRILTDRGYRAVEGLVIGDRLVTMSGPARPIRWIGRRSYSGRFAAGNRDVLPIRIQAGALADGVPMRDLFVSPLHAMFLDGMLIPAKVLVNGVSIVQMAKVEAVEYFHLELASHDVILAEGAPAESFLDDGSRGMFNNAAKHRALYPNRVTTPTRYCAPVVEDGTELEAVRQRISARFTATAGRVANGQSR